MKILHRDIKVTLLSKSERQRIFGQERHRQIRGHERVESDKERRHV